MRVWHADATRRVDALRCSFSFSLSLSLSFSVSLFSLARRAFALHRYRRMVRLKKSHYDEHISAVCFSRPLFSAKFKFFCVGFLCPWNLHAVIAALRTSRLQDRVCVSNDSHLFHKRIYSLYSLGINFISNVNNRLHVDPIDSAELYRMCGFNRKLIAQRMRL